MTMQQKDSGIIVYGTEWCGDCRLARLVLNKLQVEYTDIDIDSDADAEAKVLELNGGSRSVPTILFPDGTKMIEPSRQELTEKLASLEII